MSTTLETDASAGSKSTEAAGTSVARRAPIWPILTISLGLLATVTWDAFLAWAVGRMIGAF